MQQGLVDWQQCWHEEEDEPSGRCSTCLHCSHVVHIVVVVEEAAAADSKEQLDVPSSVDTVVRCGNSEFYVDRYQDAERCMDQQEASRVAWVQSFQNEPAAVAVGGVGANSAWAAVALLSLAPADVTDCEAIDPPPPVPIADDRHLLE